MTMMKRDVYVLKKDLESCVIESCVAGAICLMSAKYWGTRLRRGYREKKKKLKRVKQLRELLTEKRSVGEKSHPRRQLSRVTAKDPGRGRAV